MIDQWGKLSQYAGKFVGVDPGAKDEVVEMPTPPAGVGFPIRAGEWPNSHIGARQARCSSCHDFVGISPKGWELHKQNPTERPMFCGFCFDVLMDVIAKAQGSKSE